MATLAARGAAAPRLARIGSAGYLQTHGRLLLRVTRNDLHKRYAGSLLGIGWAFCGPLLVLAIYAAVYVEVFRVRVPTLGRAEYVLYVFSGLVPYLATAEAISNGVASVVANKAVLNNTVFPIDLTPVKAVAAAQAVMLAGMATTLVGAAATGNIHPTLVLLPLIWALNVAWLVGVTWVLSLLNVIVRDLQPIVASLLFVLLIASPIAYTPDMVPASVKPLLLLNPFAYFVVAYQRVIMLGRWPTPGAAAVLLIMTAVTFVAGSWFFNRAKPALIDYV